VAVARVVSGVGNGANGPTTAARSAMTPTAGVRRALTQAPIRVGTVVKPVTVPTVRTRTTTLANKRHAVAATREIGLSIAMGTATPSVPTVSARTAKVILAAPPPTQSTATSSVASALAPRRVSASTTARRSTAGPAAARRMSSTVATTRPARIAARARSGPNGVVSATAAVPSARASAPAAEAGRTQSGLRGVQRTSAARPGSARDRVNRPPWASAIWRHSVRPSPTPPLRRPRSESGR
jgi:hypothetical protein